MGRETNKSRREAQATSAREKAAAARLAQRQADQRKRAIVIISSVVAVAVIGAVIALVAVNSNGKTKPTGPATAASSAVLADISQVPASTLDTIGKGSAGGPIQPISDPSTGKPNFFFVGGEFCPFCAGERWAIIQALSRFGTFNGLQQIRSSEDNYATFDFQHATYSSKYLTFTAREVSDQNRQPLQQLTADQQATFLKHSPSGTFPFVDINGMYSQVGAGYDVTVLNGLTQAQIAAQLKDPNSNVAKAIDGEANILTAAICKATGNKPASVCTSAITALQSQLGT